MFQTVRLKSDEYLTKLVTQTKAALRNNIIEITYPDILKKNIGKEIWTEIYKEIDSLNKQTLKNIKERGGIYTIFTAKPKHEWELKYIGQVKSSGARQRIRSHLVWRNKNTSSGKSTGSKFDHVVSAVTQGHEIAFSFVEINPQSLRHYVEEILIIKCQPPWNINGTSLEGQRRKRFTCI